MPLFDHFPRLYGGIGACPGLSKICSARSRSSAEVGSRSKVHFLITSRDYMAVLVRARACQKWALSERLRAPFRLARCPEGPRKRRANLASFAPAPRPNRLARSSGGPRNLAPQLSSWCHYLTTSRGYRAVSWRARTRQKLARLEVWSSAEDRHF